MPGFIDEMQDAARRAIDFMRDSALAARDLHARAELLRHMRTTALKVADRPRAEAVAFVVREWMAAWRLEPDADPALNRDLVAFTDAVCSYVERPGEAEDTAVRQATAALDAAFGRRGSSLADEMAWRSECAHGWWELVRPMPADLPGGSAEPRGPRPGPGRPFWTAGAADHCG